LVAKVKEKTMANKKTLRGMIMAAAAVCLAFAACDDGGTSGGGTGNGQIPASITGTWQVTANGYILRYEFDATEWTFLMKAANAANFTADSRGTYTKSNATITFTVTNTWANGSWVASEKKNPKPATLTGSTTFTQVEPHLENATLTYTKIQ
jgi:hypothetical protein